MYHVAFPGWRCGRNSVSWGLPRMKVWKEQCIMGPSLDRGMEGTMYHRAFLGWRYGRHSVSLDLDWMKVWEAQCVMVPSFDEVKCIMVPSLGEGMSSRVCHGALIGWRYERHSVLWDLPKNEGWMDSVPWYLHWMEVWEEQCAIWPWLDGGMGGTVCHVTMIGWRYGRNIVPCDLDWIEVWEEVYDVTLIGWRVWVEQCVMWPWLDSGMGGTVYHCNSVVCCITYHCKITLCDSMQQTRQILTNLNIVITFCYPVSILLLSNVFICFEISNYLSLLEPSN